jgi:hypothetical protein
MYKGITKTCLGGRVTDVVTCLCSTITSTSVGLEGLKVEQDMIRIITTQGRYVRTRLPQVKCFKKSGSLGSVEGGAARTAAVPARAARRIAKAINAFRR